MTDNSSRTLMEYYIGVVKPLTAFRNRTTRKYYKRAVRVFLEFIGNQEITIAEITPQHLLDFDVWAAERFDTKHKPNVRGRRLDYYFGSIIRGILNAADGERFKRRINESAEKRKDIAAIPAKAKEPPPEGSLLHFFETVYRPKRLRGKAPNTSVQYRMTIARFGRFLGRTPMLSDLTDDQIEGFLLWRMEPRSISPATANKDRCQLCAMGNLAARKGLAQWVEVQKEKVPHRTPRAWTREQLAKLFAACKETKGWIGSVRASDYWIALHEVLWNTGERINAIRQLHWEHVDLESGWLFVPAEFRKFGMADMPFKLGAETVAALQAIRLPERQEIFPWPHSRDYLWTLYDKILERAGLPHGRKDKFHKMRRSVASHLEAAGGNATAALGHSGRSVTERSYIDPSIVPRIHPVDLLFRPDAPIGGAT